MKITLFLFYHNFSAIALYTEYLDIIITIYDNTIVVHKSYVLTGVPGAQGNIGKNKRR
jgi:hypothetical protein